MDLTLILILIAVGVILIAVDFYIPGFILGSIGILLMIVATIFCVIHHSLTTTLAIVCTEILLGGLAAWLSLKYFPRSKLGQRMILHKTLDTARASQGANPELIGREGIAQTVLRPSGIGQIDGKRLDVVAESDMIERGSPIRVVAVEGNRIVVRKI